MESTSCPEWLGPAAVVRTAKAIVMERVVPLFRGQRSRRPRGPAGTVFATRDAIAKNSVGWRNDTLPFLTLSA